MKYSQNYFDNMKLTPRGMVAYEMYSKLMQWGSRVKGGRNEYYEEAGRVLAEFERLEASEYKKSEVL